MITMSIQYGHVLRIEDVTLTPTMCIHAIVSQRFREAKHSMQIGLLDGSGLGRPCLDTKGPSKVEALACVQLHRHEADRTVNISQIDGQ